MEALVASTPARSKNKAYIREYIAIIKTLLFDH